MNTVNAAKAKPSRKSKVKVAFNEQGAEVAWTLGRKLKLADSTLRTWLSQWRRDAAKATPKVKPGKKSKPAPKVEPAAKPLNGGESSVATS